MENLYYILPVMLVGGILYGTYKLVMYEFFNKKHTH